MYSLFQTVASLCVALKLHVSMGQVHVTNLGFPKCEDIFEEAKLCNKFVPFLWTSPF